MMDSHSTLREILPNPTQERLHTTNSVSRHSTTNRVRSTPLSAVSIGLGSSRTSEQAQRPAPRTVQRPSAQQVQRPSQQQVAQRSASRERSCERPSPHSAQRPSQSQQRPSQQQRSTPSFPTAAVPVALRIVVGPSAPILGQRPRRHANERQPSQPSSSSGPFGIYFRPGQVPAPENFTIQWDASTGGWRLQPATQR
jgi:hypothetical protein